jgi:hypothetical protein
MSLARVAQALGAGATSEATAGYAPVPPPGAPAAEHIDGVCSPSLTRTSQDDNDDGSRDMENGGGGGGEQSSARGCCVDGTVFRVSVIALLCVILLSVWMVLLQRDTRLFDAGPVILQHGSLRADDPPALNRWALHFLALQKRFELLCNQGSHNRVMNRVDGSYPGKRPSATNSHTGVRTKISLQAPCALLRLELTGFRCFRAVCICVRLLSQMRPTRCAAGL